MSRFPPRRLLVGVVDSGLSDDAAHAAARLARRFSADLELVHAVHVPPAMWFGIDREELTRMHGDAVAAADGELRDHLDEVERHFGLEREELSGRVVCLAGDAGRVLLERAELTHADVLFVGLHERRKLFDFGSTLRSLLHRLQAPLWLQAGPWQEIERILVPVDFSRYSRAALDAAAALARGLEAGVTVMHAFQPIRVAYPPKVVRAIEWPSDDRQREAAEEQMAAFISDTDWGKTPHDELFVDGEPQAEILARSSAAQLVVMGGRGYGGLLGPLLGHVCYEVLKQSRVPVLVVHA